MKPVYSIFTETLQELTKYSKRIDTMKVTDTDFVDFQELETKIIKRYENNYYKEPEYMVLSNLACKLHRMMEDALAIPFM